MPIPVSALIGSPRRLVTAIVLFVALDLSVLLINLWIAEQVARDAVAINLAGRQRMLSQQTTKALLLATLPNHGQNTESAQKEFEDAFGLFSKTLTAFADGGETSGGDGPPYAFNRYAAKAPGQWLRPANSSPHYRSATSRTPPSGPGPQITWCATTARF